MKPSKLRRVLAHKDRLLGVTPDRSIRDLARVKEGQGGFIADRGMSSPVSHGMTRSNHRSVDRRMESSAAESHFKFVVRTLPMVLAYHRWGQIRKGKTDYFIWYPA